MAVDVVSRYLYWGSSSAASVGLVSLDGPVFYRRVILSSSNYAVASPVDMAVDPLNGSAVRILCLSLYIYFIIFIFGALTRHTVRWVARRSPGL